MGKLERRYGELTQEKYKYNVLSLRKVQVDLGKNNLYIFYRFVKSTFKYKCRVQKSQSPKKYN